MGAAPMTEPKFLKLVKDTASAADTRRTAWTWPFRCELGRRCGGSFACSRTTGCCSEGGAMQKGGSESAPSILRFPAGVAVAGDWTARPCTVVLRSTTLLHYQEGGGQVFRQ